ncbi:hypothetical protein Hdeb2414_s0002g00060431 [Helianthus debilis subsp. tardiflorus]
MNMDRNEFVEVAKKMKAQNKDKKPVWQPKKTYSGPLISEPGTSRQGGLYNADHMLGSCNGTGQGKPSDKAAGLQNRTEPGPPFTRLNEFPPLSSGLRENENPAVMRAGLGQQPVLSAGLCNNANSKAQFRAAADVGFQGGEAGPSQRAGPSSKPILEPVLQPIVDSIVEAQKTYGSGFFDVSKNDFGSNLGPMCNTKNSFGSLIDEEECFNTDVGLWEHEIEKVKKLVETSTRPKIEEYKSWSENMRKYYDGLTKMNEDDEVASETDETARFMKLGVKS